MNLARELKWQMPAFIRKYGLHLKHKGRMISANKRALPDFIIVGAYKSGTSSLYSYLSQHPEVHPSWHKEVHFFDLNFHKGPMWYRSHFPLTSFLRIKGMITGEASPYYMFHPHAAKRIKDLLPDIKLIFILRNPVDRAISHYFHEVKANRESLLLEEALEKEKERIDQEYKVLLSNPLYDGQAYQHFSYKKRGIYIDQILEYDNFFFSNQMLFLKSEDLFLNPLMTLKQVFRFIDIESNFMPGDLKPRNIGSGKLKVSENVYNYLQSYYLTHNKRLYDYLGRDLNW